MRSLKLFFVVFFFINSVAFSQSIIKHKVKKGETIYAIAKKYEVTPAEIYKLNPQLKNAVLQLKTVVKIPKKDTKDSLVQNTTDFSKAFNHTVKNGETLYGISKKYGLTISDLKQLNPSSSTKLKIGTVLILRSETSNSIGENSIAAQTKIDSISERNKEDLKPVAEVPTKIDSLIDAALSHLGARYKSGGTGKRGFDCSGLVLTSFKKINTFLPRSSRQMAKIGTVVDSSTAKKGDLIFFNTDGNRKTINHVGMITEVTSDDIKFVHSSTQLGVIVSSIKEPYYSKRLIQINRVLHL